MQTMMGNATVTTTGDRFSTTYCITGPEAAVRNAVESIKEMFPPNGYMTEFNKPSRLIGNAWICRGSRANSCD